MLTNIRRFTKSWVALLFIIPMLVLAFVFVGMDDAFKGGGGNSVINVGDRRLNDQTFKLQFERAKGEFEQQSGQPISMEDVDRRGFVEQFLESTAQEEAFLAWAWRAGIRPGAELLAAQIRTIPAFFNQITGAFDPETYRARLAEAGLTQALFETEMRDQIIVQHYGTALYAGMRLPRAYGALVAAQGLEERDARWFEVTQAIAGTAPAPTDEQLQAFLDENADALRIPEFRRVTAVIFTPATVMDDVEVTEEQIVERFNFRREALSTPETRSFVTLTVRDREIAQRISQALRAGQSVEDVARANNVEPVTYDQRPQSSVIDRRVGTSAFSLSADAISDPIEGDLGWSVIKMQSVTPGRAATLENVRAAIVQELQQEAARGRVFELVEAFEAARADGASLTDAAERVGVRPISLPPFTSEGLLPNTQRLNAPDQIFSTAFAMSVDTESDLVDAGNSQYFALRLEEVQPASLPPLAEVRPFLAEQWVARENARLLRTRADELAGRVRGGEDIAEVAASVGAPIVVRTGIIQNRDAQESLGGGVLQAVFGQAPGQVFTAPRDQSRVAVGRVDAARAPDPQIAAVPAQQFRPRISGQVAEDMLATAQREAASSMSVRTNPERARRALNLPERRTAPASAQ